MRRRGFSLVESIVSTTLVAVVTLATLGLMPSLRVATQRGNHMLTANAVARTLVEQTRCRPFESLQPGQEQSLALPCEPGFAMSATAQVSAYKAMDPEKVKLVCVRVTWQDGARTQTIDREVLVCHDGLF